MSYFIVKFENAFWDHEAHEAHVKLTIIVIAQKLENASLYRKLGDIKEEKLQIHLCVQRITRIYNKKSSLFER